MKKLIGVDIDGSGYTFDASAKTVTITGVPTLTVDQILGITNITDQELIYLPVDSAKGGTIAANVLTLEHDTTAMGDTDDLQIWVYLPDVKTITYDTITGSVSLPADIYAFSFANVGSVDVTFDGETVVPGEWVSAEDAEGITGEQAYNATGGTAKLIIKK